MPLKLAGWGWGERPYLYMEIIMKRKKVGDRTVVYGVGIRNEVVTCDEYCECEVRFNFHGQREQKMVRDGRYVVRKMMETDVGLVVWLEGWKWPLTMPYRAMRKEVDDGGWYFSVKPPFPPRGEIEMCFC